MHKQQNSNGVDSENQPKTDPTNKSAAERVKEIGGIPGPEPTRFGDWEKNGRCVDF
ncbi:MAG: DUF1674 domain-containing protein [Gammaproteobacteria bacterium]